MTIWILALVLLAVLAAVGYSQGAVRVAFSLIGLVTGALLALPLARVVKPIFPPLGVEHPLWIWALAPLVVFVLILILFKTAGLFVHKKIDVYYKYKTGDLRRALWERLNRRLGLCLGLVNGTIYLVLISVLIYPFSYLTFQTASGDQDSKMVRLLNKAGRDLQTTGLARTVAAIAPVPGAFYDASDIAGLIHQNRLVYSRLSQYPLFLSFSEQPEFRDIGSDKQYTEMWLRQAPMSEVANHPKTQAIFRNKQLLNSIWDRTLPCLQDLRTFLETGKSPKYEAEKILGRWDFDVSGSILALKRARPNLRSSDLRQLRLAFFPLLKKATLMATPENQVFIKDLVRIKPVATPPGAGGRLPPSSAPSIEAVNLQGTWKATADGYRLSFSEHGKSLRMDATVDAEKMTITGEAFPLVFQRQY